MRRTLIAFGVVAALTGGCPRKPPPDPVAEPVAPLPPAPTLVRSFDELAPDLYGEFAESESGELLVADLAAGHDVYRWTTIRTRWGERPVLEFRDTDRPETWVEATAGWILGADTAEGSETVESALLRDFADAPSATDPQELMSSLEAWLPPWSFCRPVADDRATELIAYDAERGLKFGLVPHTDDEGIEGWIVDNVEFFVPREVLDDWWLAKEYGGCEALGVLVEPGRFKPERKPRE